MKAGAHKAFYAELLHMVRYLQDLETHPDVILGVQEGPLHVLGTHV